MTISTKHYGSIGGNPSKIIQLTVFSHNGNSILSEDITDLHGNVDVNFIDQLKDLVHELEEQNEKIQELKTSK